MAKWLSPNLMSGVDGKPLRALMDRLPFFKLYKLLMTSSKSDVFLTGKKRLRGTLRPMDPSKHFMAAPTAVSNWMTLSPLSKVFGLTITSMSRVSFSMIRLMDGSLTHRLLVLKNLNVLIDLKSSTFSLGTWAISSRRSLFSYWISVPPCKSETKCQRIPSDNTSDGDLP